MISMIFVLGIPEFGSCRNFIQNEDKNVRWLGKVSRVLEPIIRFNARGKILISYRRSIHPQRSRSFYIRIQSEVLRFSPIEHAIERLSKCLEIRPTILLLYKSSSLNRSCATLHDRIRHVSRVRSYSTRTPLWLIENSLRRFARCVVSNQ